MNDCERVIKEIEQENDLKFKDIRDFFISKGYTNFQFIQLEDSQEEVIYIENPTNKKRINFTIDFID
jgi:hypothetical protein|tara:strand:- start:298 stop:498 length:201 start_codon:yes stop_codon:yes gene_type:complete